jgi:hypothetical protein
MEDEEPKLEEKDFIHEGVAQNPFPFWFWIVMIALFAALVWGGKSWFTTSIQDKIATNSFLQVTNREFSLFLWEFPEHMRINAKTKTGYLPAFQYMDNVSVEPDLADKYVNAPPELLFQYHTWNRLLSRYYFPSPISVSEFKNFINYDEQWKPQYWPQAPKDYVTFVKSLLGGQINDIDLQVMPSSSLPTVVKKAFQGWKNYTMEGSLINNVQPSFAEMKEFIQANNNYARNYWRNLLLTTYPNYLKTFEFGNVKSTEPLPNKELTPFLKAAFFNYTQAYHNVGASLDIGPAQ